MSKTRLPEGWDEATIQSVLAQYEKQAENEALIEDESGLEVAETLMTLPHDLVPEVREMIARHNRESK